MTREQKVVRAKVGMPGLTRQPGKVSQARRVRGCFRIRSGAKSDAPK
jgi:hypothetical protein